MQGAREYSDLFETGQYGKLYIISSSHARGRTFRIQILPEGEEALPNGRSNPCLNENAIEVYGVVGGNPGWTESYGWLHRGKWVDDFKQLVKEKTKAREIKNVNATALAIEEEDKERKRIQDLLDKY